MLSYAENTSKSSPLYQKRSPSPTPRNGVNSSAISSKYLMNDIPRGTRPVKLINSLLMPPHRRNPPPVKLQPEVIFACNMSDSRLDDELSVAVIKFSDTPQWLQDLDDDPYGFPKKTKFGTLWRGVDTSTGEPDAEGQTELIRAAMEGNLLYAEMLAEFEDTDVNIQDRQRRTALHWACLNSHQDVVALCLSVANCDVGLRDKDGLTAFDLARRNGDKTENIANLFYKSMLDLDDDQPQTALLRLLTVTSEPDESKAIFPGEAIFDPIRDRNSPLVIALINRGVDLTARNKDGDTALHVAAMQHQNLDIATRLRDAGSDINAIGRGGATPLHYAAGAGGEEMIQLFLDWKADTTVKDTNGKTALHWEVDNEQFGVARVPISRTAEVRINDQAGPTAPQFPLESQGQDIEVSTTGEREIYVVRPSLNDKKQWKESGLTALARAVRDTDLEAVRELLQLDKDMQARDMRGWTAVQIAVERNQSRTINDLLSEHTRIMMGGWESTALVLAAMKGHTETVTALLARSVGCNCQWRRHTPLHLAAENGHAETVTALLAGGAKVEAIWDEQTALHLAAKNGHAETVTALLASGAKVEAIWDEQTALHLAAKNGHAETVTALVAGGAKTENKSIRRRTTALHLAAANGHAETVVALLAGGAEVEATWDEQTALHLAARNGHAKTVAALLAGGAEMKAIWDEQTALHLAAKNGHAETVAALVAGRVRMEGRDAWERTALHLAAENGHAETIEALLAGGARIEGRNINEQTPLHLAGTNGRVGAVTTLLTNGAKIEPVDTWSHTTLHLAAICGATETVKALVANGAKLETRGRGGTALQLASKNGHNEVVKILVDSGAESSTAGRLRYAMLRQLGRKD